MSQFSLHNLHVSLKSLVVLGELINGDGLGVSTWNQMSSMTKECSIRLMVDRTMMLHELEPECEEFAANLPSDQDP